MKSLVKIAILLQFILFISSCKKDEDDLSGIGASPSGQTITADFNGFVKDVQGNSIAGAVVTAGGKSAITNSFGGYKIQQASVNKKRALIEVSKSGYLLQQRAIIAETGTENRVNLVMFADDKTYTLNAANGGMMSMTGGTIITFPANAFMTISGSVYSGTVYITAHEILTSDSAFAAKVPGGDLMAIDSLGEEKLLESYGMAGAELYDAAGNSLQIAQGKSATIKFPISVSQTGIAPSTIPLWHYDENEMMWKEEGSATRNGNFYVGTVSHFSWWNCDIPCDYATLTMSINGCEGNALVNKKIEITWNGQSRYGYTNSIGNCTGLVPANALLTVNCYGWNGALDTSFTIGPYSNFSTPQILISLTSNCNTCLIILEDCNGYPIDGLIQLSYNNNVFYNVYTIAGTTMVSGLNPGSYTIYANNNHWSNSSTFSISLNGPSSTVINLQLCDAITNPITGSFDVYITKFPTTTIHHLVVQDCNVQGTSITLDCMDSISYEDWTISINNSAYTVGIYPWNGVANNGVVMTKLGSLSNTNYNPGLGSTNMTICSRPGGFVTGSYSGTMLRVDNISIPDSVHVNASFDIFRME